MFTNINEHIYHTAEKLMNIKLAQKKTNSTAQT